MDNKNFKFNVAPSIVVMGEAKPDTRSYVDRMFVDFDPNTGKVSTLPVQTQDGSKISKVSDAMISPNSIPVIVNVGKSVEDYTELNGMPKGETVIVVGGVRQGKSGQGRINIPLSQVDSFCENLKALAEAVKTDLVSKV